MPDEAVQKGLEGVTAEETRLSWIDGERGELVIGGFPLEEIAQDASFEEIVFLLYEDRLPTREELDEFRADIRTYRSLSEPTREVVTAAGEGGQSAMDTLRMGIASASFSQCGDVSDEEMAILAVAQLPTIVATYWRARNGADPIEPRSDLDFAENYLYMLTGEVPADAETRGLETYLNAVVDHGFNASTFTARTIVSTESDVVSGVTGGIGALKGPLHGGAPGPVLDMIEAAHEADDVETLLREKLDAGERLMGFGHRVYRVRDPRAAVLSKAAEQFYRDENEGHRAFFETARETENTAKELLEEYQPDRSLSTNVEFYTAVLLNGIGIPRDLFTATFAVARTGGWTAHCLEQLSDNRIIRPRAKYMGERDRTWVPLTER